MLEGRQVYKGDARVPLFFPFPPAILAISPLLASCSNQRIRKTGFPGWTLDDFHLFRPAPPVVAVQEETLLPPSTNHLAYQGPGQHRAVNAISFSPPNLPAGRIALDGSLLPSKQAGYQAMLDVEGEIPGAPPATLRARRGSPEQDFSIE